jgi:hypothetical protein
MSGRRAREGQGAVCLASRHARCSFGVLCRCGAGCVRVTMCQVLCTCGRLSLVPVTHTVGWQLRGAGCLKFVAASRCAAAEARAYAMACRPGHACSTATGLLSSPHNRPVAAACCVLRQQGVNSKDRGNKCTFLYFGPMHSTNAFMIDVGTYAAGCVYVTRSDSGALKAV